MMRLAEQMRGDDLAGPLAPLLRTVATDLHHDESLHLHEATESVDDCGYCWLRAGRTLGIVARAIAGTSTAESAKTEAERIRSLLDTLSIYATRIGYRSDSTDDERALGEAMFAVTRTWNDVKPAVAVSP